MKKSNVYISYCIYKIEMRYERLSCCDNDPMSVCQVLQCEWQHLIYEIFFAPFRRAWKKMYNSIVECYVPPQSFF